MNVEKRAIGELGGASLVAYATVAYARTFHEAT